MLLYEGKNGFIINLLAVNKLYGTMLIKDNKSFIKQLIKHFAGTGSKAGTMLIKVNKSFNIHLTVNECYILSRLKKGQIKNTFNLP